MKLLLSKSSTGALIPIDDEGEKVLRGIKAGDVVEINLTRPRNVKLLRLYWVMVGLVLENQSMFATKEELSDALKMEVGHYERRVSFDGAAYTVPKSISMTKMDEDAFRLFFQRCLDVVFAKILPRCDNRAFKEEIFMIARMPLSFLDMEVV